MICFYIKNEFQSVHLSRTYEWYSDWLIISVRDKYLSGFMELTGSINHKDMTKGHIYSKQITGV